MADHVNMVREGGIPKRRGKGETEAGPLFKLYGMRLPQINEEFIKGWLKRESAIRPTYTALAFRLLRAFLRWCDTRKEFKGAVDLTAVSASISGRLVPKPKAKEGDSLQREQLPAWFKEVRELSNPVMSAYLQGLLITGARREELAWLKWPDVDFKWKSMTIHDKVEGDRVIPLTPYLAGLLYALPRRKDKKGKAIPWVFSSPTAATGRIREPRIAHKKALDAAGLPHVTLHGLRRSFGTLAEWVEVPSGIVAQIMGHKPTAIAEKHYRRRPLDMLRMWHVRIEAWMLEQAGIEQPEEDVQGLRVIKGGKA